MTRRATHLLKPHFTSQALASLLLLVLLLLPLALAQAQNYEEMRTELNEKQKQTRQEIASLQQQISSYQERLTEAEKKYDRVYKQFKNLTKEIALRDALIEKRKEELNHIVEQINLTEKRYQQKEQELEKLIAEYEKTLTYVYQHGRSSDMALLLTAKSFNQMLIRSYYLDKFEEHRQQQAAAIDSAKTELAKTRDALEKQKSEKESVLAKIEQEQQKLQERKNQQEEYVTKLREDRTQLKNKLDEVRKQAKVLNNTLTQLVLREEQVRKAQIERRRRLEEERKRRLAAAKKIKDEQKRKVEVAKYSEPIDEEDYLDESALANIEQSFAKSKGELPWPAKGVISEEFGTRVHPVYGTRITNHGIEIATKPRSTVRVIHDGYVSAIRPIPGYGDVVLINHGRFKTAYGNLSQVMVRKNRQLRAGDIIGLSGDTNSPRGETVFFMIREKDTNLNPEKWIVSK